MATHRQVAAAACRPQNGKMFMANYSLSERPSPPTPDRGRGSDWVLKVGLSLRMELAAGQALGGTACSAFAWVALRLKRRVTDHRKTEAPIQNSTVINQPTYPSGTMPKNMLCLKAGSPKIEPGMPTQNINVKNAGSLRNPLLTVPANCMSICSTMETIINAGGSATKTPRSDIRMDLCRMRTRIVVI